ncbi:MAG: hypothetical protein ACU4EQ_08205 [Candidatus Nitrosoglobus sp.]|jgi:integrase
MLTRCWEKAIGPYVFESTRGRLSNLHYAKAEIESHSGVPFCIHDLRRTSATIADALDIPGYAVKALLKHKAGNNVTAGYIIIDVERLRAPMREITDYMLIGQWHSEGGGGGGAGCSQ